MLIVQLNYIQINEISLDRNHYVNLLNQFKQQNNLQSATTRPASNNNSLDLNHIPKYLSSVIIISVYGIVYSIIISIPSNMGLLECYKAM